MSRDFAATTSSLGAEFFLGNRQRLRELFGGTAPIVITGNSLVQKSADDHYPFTQDSNFWYLTGINEPGFILVIDGDKEYLIRPEGSASYDVFSGSIDEEEVKAISAVELVFSNKEGWKNLDKKLSKVKHVATLQPAPIFIDELTMFTSPAKALLVKKFKDINLSLDLIDLTPMLRTMRSVKSIKELDLVRSAIKATAELYKLLAKKLKVATSETDLMAELSRETTLFGLEFAYQPIIASGKNALTLHYNANNSPLEYDKFLLLDIGVKYGNYCSDITRTIACDPTKRQTQIYEAILATQSYAISLLKPGVLLRDYEELVKQFMGEKLRELGLIKTIDKDAIRKFYPHSTSHFLGIDPHDAGDYEKPLAEGMVLTVEPGIYIQSEGQGIRIEDDVLITKDGNQVLSGAIPKVIDTL